MASIDPDLDVGGRISLQDAFTSVAQRIGASFTSMRTTFVSGAGFIGRAIHSMTGGLGGIGTYIFGGGGILAGLGALAKAAVNAGSSMENNRIAFETLLGSASAAQAHLEELQNFAIGKPFEFTQLIGASRKLQSFGFQVKDVKGLLTDMGNAVFTANTGQRGLEQFIRVFGRIHATGKTTIGNLNTLVNAGFKDVYQVLRQELNLTSDQLANIARSGIPAERVIAALRKGLQDKFSGGMERASQTITARLSDLKDVAEKFLTVVGDELKPTIKGFLDEFSRDLGKVDFKAFGKVVADVLSTVMRLLRIVVQPFVGAFGDVGKRWASDTNSAGQSLRAFASSVRDVIRGVTALVTSSDEHGVASIPRSLKKMLVERGLWTVTVEISKWVNRVRALIRGLVLTIGPIFVGMGRTLLAVGSALGIVTSKAGINAHTFEQVGRTVGTLLALYLQYRAAMTAMSVAMGIVRVATMAWQGVQWLLNVALSANPIGAIVVAIAALVAAIALVIVYWDKIKPAILRAWAPIAAFFSRIVGYVRTHFPMVARVVQVVIGVIVRAAKFVWNVLTTVFGAIVGAVKTAFYYAKIVVQTAVLLWWATIVTVGMKIKNAVMATVHALAAIWSRIKGPFVAVWNVVVGVLNVVRRGFAKFWTAIKGMGMVVWNWIGDKFATIKDIILTPIRWIVRQILALFDALPDWAKPDSLRAMAANLATFANADQQPAPGETPAGANAQSLGDRVRERVAEQRARFGAPNVTVNTPATPAQVGAPIKIVMQLRDKILGEAIVTHNETQAQRGGQL